VVVKFFCAADRLSRRRWASFLTIAVLPVAIQLIALPFLPQTQRRATIQRVPVLARYQIPPVCMARPGILAGEYLRDGRPGFWCRMVVRENRIPLFDTLSGHETKAPARGPLPCGSDDGTRGRELTRLALPDILPRRCRRVLGIVSRGGLDAEYGLIRAAGTHVIQGEDRQATGAVDRPADPGMRHRGATVPVGPNLA
jgi:hypothetical protein